MVKRLLHSLPLAALMVALATPPPAHAFVVDYSRWRSNSAYYVLSGALSSAEKSYVKSSGAVWNNAPAPFTLYTSTSSSVYSIWSKTDFSYWDWDDVPGMTWVTKDARGNILKCKSYLNTDFTWNNNGVMDIARRVCDYKTVIIHEFGHWLWLGHPNNHPEAVMWPNGVVKQALAGDDRNGIDYLY